MWPIHTLEPELITIACSPKHISFCWIQKNNHNASFYVRAYERHELHHLELENLTLFNPTRIKQLITSFLTKHNKQNAFVALSLSGPGITEKYVAHSSSTPNQSDFGIQHSSNLLWDYRYFYPNDHGQFIFYLYTMPRALLLQYQLLAISAKLNIIIITTKRMALFNTYKNIFGTAFRRSQFGIDMITHHNNIEELIPAPILQRMIVIPTTIPITEEYTHLATAYGLFTLGELS